MRRVIICLAVVACAAFPAFALAHRSAPASEAKAIRAAAVKAHQISSKQARCMDVAISSANGSYAEISWPRHMSNTCMRVAADGVIVMHRRAATWAFVTAGSSFTCPIRNIPASVSRDFGLCH
jgi:hypothetical protein